MMTALLIVHGLLAVALLGAVTHQALAAVWPLRAAAAPGQRSFFDRFRGVNGPAYANAVVILFVITFIIGGIIYPAYRLNVRTYLQDYRMLGAEGLFEIKEHLTAIALALLPFYWFLWKRPVATEQGQAFARAAVTTMIAVAAWWSFFAGHILNNIRGLFGT